MDLSCSSILYGHRHSLLCQLRWCLRSFTRSCLRQCCCNCSLFPVNCSVCYYLTCSWCHLYSLLSCLILLWYSQGNLHHPAGRFASCCRAVAFCSCGHWIVLKVSSYCYCRLPRSIIRHIQAPLEVHPSWGSSVAIIVSFIQMIASLVSHSYAVFLCCSLIKWYMLYG